ncbi:MAG: hypothetical protein WCY09_04550 [Candidatus Omnitrophota bacterium]
MEKFGFLKLILVFVLSVFLIAFFTAACDDEDSALDIFCDIDGFFRYDELFAGILFQSGVLYEHSTAIPPKSFMAYLERHEKSPPFNPIIFS